MQREVRYEAAISAARQILGVFGPLARGPEMGVTLGKVAYVVLEAIYQSEIELTASAASPLLCLGCLHSSPVRPDHPAEACPRCGAVMRLADTALLN